MGALGTYKCASPFKIHSALVGSRPTGTRNVLFHNAYSKQSSTVANKRNRLSDGIHLARVVAANHLSRTNNMCFKMQ